MKSIAIWWDPNSKDLENQVQLHLDINLWRRDDRDLSYIEFGIKILSGQPSHINIAMPFKVNMQALEDMSEKIDESVGQVLFNDQFSITKISNSRIRPCALQASGKKINLCSLTKEDGEISPDFINIQEDYAGHTKITIQSKKYYETIHGENAKIPLYFRFRIKSASNIYETKNENIFFLDGLFKKCAFLDLNINSPRKLPEKLVKDIEGIKFNSINMFLISAGVIGFDFQSEQLKRSRILEDRGWETYNPYYITRKTNRSKNKKEKYVAYHWKAEEIEKKPLSEYSLFLKFQFLKRNWLALVFMFATILFFGVAGGVLGNLITTKCFNGFQDTTPETQKENNITG